MSKFKNRRMIRMYVRGEAKSAVEELARTTGMTETAIVSRLVEWFSALPWSVQREVLQPHSELRADVARLILERWSKDEA